MPGRWGLRPDSMTVASIDAETGKTVLISLPRNMQNFPFAEGSVMAEQFPDGFDAEGMYLNGLSTWALDHAALFKGSKNPGVDATIQGVEGITGLKMNYWAMVNLEGFKDLVDAVGGVELNVRQPIPVGLPWEKTFHYIDPGKRTLDGHDTLWFARAREGSDDYSRMARQKCVMSAMLQQVSPQVALRNFEQIAGASEAMVSTDIPRGEVDRFVDLALKARSQKIATLSLVPPMINTAHPDIALVQQKVAAAIAKAEGDKPPRRRPPRPLPRRDARDRGARRDARHDLDPEAVRARHAHGAAVRHRRLGRLAGGGLRGERVGGPRRGVLRREAVVTAFPRAAPRVYAVTTGPLPRIVAVVVTFNRLGLLQKLVERLGEIDGIGEVLVVDNASSDGTGEWLDAAVTPARCRCARAP